MTTSQTQPNLGSPILGFPVTQFGGRMALGGANGRGGVTIEQFRRQRGTNTVLQLSRLGIDARLQPSGRPSQFNIVF